MNHDPLCPALGHDTWPVMDLCRCDLIAKVEARERQQARQRVEALLDEWAWGRDFYPRNAILDAAGGES